MDRRAFLGLVGRGLAAAELARLFPAALNGATLVNAQVPPLAAAALGTDADTTGAILDTALAGIGGIERFVQPGMTVAIKPNATWAYPPNTASSSDPELLRLLIQKVKAAGAARVIVMDHCSIEPGTAEAIRVNGIDKVVKEESVEGLFPDRNNAPKTTYTSIDLPSGKAFNKLNVIKAAVEADLRINLAVAKTHNVTRMTMCLKHMMGFLSAPGRLHANLEQGIADLSTPSPIQAQLHILEALRVRLPYGTYRVCAGPETEVTNPKVVQRRNQIIAGTDPLLIDTYGCVTFFDMLPEELPYLQYAFDSGIGEMDLDMARERGRLVLLKVGETAAAAPTPVPTTETVLSEPTLSAAVEPTAAEPSATRTPLPTEIPQSAAGDLPVGIEMETAGSAAQVIDPRPFLNTALIPAAVVVTGAGLVAAGRVKRGKEETDKDQGAPPHETG